MNLQLVNAIRTLSSSASVRKSKVKRIRELLPEINRAQQVGICLSDIAMTLKESGFEGMNLKCLQNLMYQARKGEKLVSDNSPRKLSPTASENYKDLSINEGINADSILEEARKSMHSKIPSSSITLNLLRSQPQSTDKFKEIK